MERYKEQPFTKQPYKKYVSLKNSDWLLGRTSYLRSNHLRINYKKKFVHSMKMLNLSLSELKLMQKVEVVKVIKASLKRDF